MDDLALQAMARVSHVDAGSNDVIGGVRMTMRGCGVLQHHTRDNGCKTLKILKLPLHTCCSPLADRVA